jgi:leucyl/phenylalanyl-tRNA--protein transferase
MTACAQPRPKSAGGTWITPAMIAAYVKLHELGHAHSVEVWNEKTLVGGVYGIALGGVFFGESMFAYETDASKVAFVRLVRQLARWGYTLIDCQQYTAHLARFGAEEIPRREFLHRLTQALTLPGRPGCWILEANGLE